MDKIGNLTDNLNDFSSQNQFDVDLVMKKSCTTTSKLLSKRAKQFGNSKQSSPKKAIKVSALKLDEVKEQGITDSKS